MVIVSVITQNNMASLYSYLHVCLILHQTYIQCNMHSFVSEKMIHKFQMSLLNNFHRMQCPSPLMVSSMDLWPSAILVQRLRSFCSSCAVERWTRFPNPREEWPPERCSDSRIYIGGCSGSYTSKIDWAPDYSIGTRNICCVEIIDGRLIFYIVINRHVKCSRYLINMLNHMQILRASESLVDDPLQLLVTLWKVPSG